MIVELRPLRPEDAAISFAWRNDPLVWTYTTAAGRGPVTEATERAWIEQVIRHPHERRCAILVDGAYVGNVYLMDIGDGNAQFHIFIGDRRIWGRGVGGRATAAMLEIGWRDLDLERIHLFVHRDNAAAVTLYQRVGFVLLPQKAPGEGFVRMVAANPHQPGKG